MRRLAQQPRPDWQAKIAESGLIYNDQTGHWREDAAYEFSLAEIETVEAASVELHGLCLKALDHIAAHPDEMNAFGIPYSYRDYVLASLRRQDPYLMGRFDLAFDPATQRVSLLEYNADTPTLVIETALTQWYWLQETHPDADQFNSLHEKLRDRLQAIGRFIPPGERLYFSAMPDALEESQHCTYLLDLAEQAGLPAQFIAVPDIGWREDTQYVNGAFVDLSGRQIRFLHKLYPWEWLAQERFGPHIAPRPGRHRRAGMEDAVVEQGAAGAAVAAVSRPSQPAALFVERGRGRTGLRRQADPVARRGEHNHGPRRAGGGNHARHI